MANARRYFRISNLDHSFLELPSKVKSGSSPNFREYKKGINILTLIHSPVSLYSLNIVLLGSPPLFFYKIERNPMVILYLTFVQLTLIHYHLFFSELERFKLVIVTTLIASYFYNNTPIDFSTLVFDQLAIPMILKVLYTRNH